MLRTPIVTLTAERTMSGVAVLCSALSVVISSNPISVDSVTSFTLTYCEAVALASKESNIVAMHSIWLFLRGLPAGNTAVAVVLSLRI